MIRQTILSKIEKQTKYLFVYDKAQIDVKRGHDDENALIEGKDKHWGWILEHKATMIQTDRPQELIHYLEEKGLRDLE